jgi:Phage tail lysozyme
VIGAVGAWQLMPSGASADAGGSSQDGTSHGAMTGRSQPTITTAQLFVSGAARGPALKVPGPVAVPGSHRAGSRSAPATSRSTSAAKRAEARQDRPKPRRSPAKKAFLCTGSVPAGMLPANYGAIVTYLVGHGYTPIAATGIAGNIYQESKGNPESVGTGGGGLIGWTPLPAGFVTGNVAADLQTQLAALLTYNQQWAQYIPDLNAATTPTAAADVYMNYFERPGLPAAYNREGAAQAVAQACGIGG